MIIRPFIDTLRELRSGKTLDELGEQLNAIVSAVQRCGKQGVLTIRLTVKPAARGDLETLLVADQITAKIPEGDRAPTLFFGTPDGNLTRQHKRQGELLRGVDDAVETIRSGGKP